MTLQYDQLQQPAPIQDAWSRAWGDPALQDLGRRLDAYGIPAEEAATVVEQIWLFYSYEALPFLGERVPMGIAARDGERPAVWLYLPFRTDVSGSDRQLASPRFWPLNRTFVEKFEQPLADWVTLDLERMTVSADLEFRDPWVLRRFQDDVREAAARKNMEFVGTFVDNLVAELMTVMNPEAVSTWLDTPNTLFGGQRPIELVDEPRDQQLRDVITRAKFNISAA